MKKTSIALSVAAALAGIAQAAENSTTLYGSLGYETQFAKNAFDTNIPVKDLKNQDYDLRNDHIWDLNKATAKLGVKGTEALNNGLEAFYKFEYGFDTTGKGLNDTRYAYIGVKGGFGTLTLGKQDSLYKTVTNYNDIYQDNWFNDLNHYGSITGGDRIAKTISYTTPDFSGFQAGVAAVLDGSHEVIENGDKDSFNAAQAGLWYDQNGFYAGLAYSWTSQDLYTSFKFTDKYGVSETDHGPGSNEVWGAAFGYGNDQFQVGLAAEHAASLGEKYNLAGQYFQGANTFRASVGLANSDDIDDDKSIYTYGLGYQYNFSKRTYTWVEGQYTDWNYDDDNGYVVRVGLRHDF